MGCGGKLTTALPNLLRGQWIIFGENYKIKTYELNLAEDGSYTEVKENSGETSTTTTKGTYSFSYSPFSFTTPSGTIIFTSEEGETKEYSFDEVLNSTYGAISLTLIRQNDKSTEKLELNYFGKEEMDE